MGMSARDWRSLITEAATRLDDTWHIIGTGRRAYLLRTPVEWRMQYLSYENTAVGRLIGYQAFLGCPVSVSQTGGRGVSGDSYIMPGESHRRLARDLLTPNGSPTSPARSPTPTTTPSPTYTPNYALPRKPSSSDAPKAKNGYTKVWGSSSSSPCVWCAPHAPAPS